ncbi:MAG: hypothetical protein ACLURV_12670 [Gallintestinimicrobium sp.]
MSEAAVRDQGLNEAPRSAIGEKNRNGTIAEKRAALDAGVLEELGEQVKNTWAQSSGVGCRRGSHGSGNIQGLAGWI